MTDYVAYGKAQYHDTTDTTAHFKANNDYDARHYIINHFDCSLAWTYESVKEAFNSINVDYIEVK